MRKVKTTMNLILKPGVLLLVLGIMGFIGCGGVKVNTAVGIPELDTALYNDSAYTAGW
ncbi:MAG: hypothetical protein QG657_693 [Acidobacteriota bacterium]|nr:hypothetical protein [Acidobacteriota bacterium]